jgi:hypothetical protein
MLQYTPNSLVLCLQAMGWPPQNNVEGLDWIVREIILNYFYNYLYDPIKNVIYYYVTLYI